METIAEDLKTMTRVASSVGEGSVVISQVWDWLERSA